jgi:hypothetical protein
VDAPESSGAGTPMPPQPLSVSRLATTLKSRLAGSFSVAADESESPVLLSEVDTGRQLIEAAKVRGGGAVQYFVCAVLCVCSVLCRWNSMQTRLHDLGWVMPVW